MTKWIWLPLLLSVGLSVQAEVKCFPEAIKSIEVAKGGDLFYATVSGIRRKLSHLSQHEGQAMLDIMRDSIGTQQIIQVIYPDGFNCKQPDLEVHAVRLKMQAPSVR